MLLHPGKFFFFFNGAIFYLFKGGELCRSYTLNKFFVRGDAFCVISGANAPLCPNEAYEQTENQRLSSLIPLIFAHIATLQIF